MSDTGTEATAAPRRWFSFNQSAPLQGGGRTVRTVEVLRSDVLGMSVGGFEPSSGRVLSMILLRGGEWMQTDHDIEQLRIDLDHFDRLCELEARLSGRAAVSQPVARANVLTLEAEKGIYEPAAAPPAGPGAAAPDELELGEVRMKRLLMPGYLIRGKAALDAIEHITRARSMRGGRTAFVVHLNDDGALDLVPYTVTAQCPSDTMPAAGPGAAAPDQQSVDKRRCAVCDVPVGHGHHARCYFTGVFTG